MAKTYKIDDAEELKQEENINNKEIFINELLDNLNGYENNMLYEDISNTEGKIIDEIFELLLDKQEINREQLLEIFARCNSYIIGFDDKNISEYLEENILHKIEQQQKVIVYKEKVSAKRKLLTYSMKVMVAAAAAIAFLVVVPTVEQQSRPNMETYVAEAKEQVNKDLQEQKEKAKKRSEEQNFLQSVNDASSAFCNFITETTNGWFLKEER